MKKILTISILFITLIMVSCNKQNVQPNNTSNPDQPDSGDTTITIGDSTYTMYRCLTLIFGDRWVSEDGTEEFIVDPNTQLMDVTRYDGDDTLYWTDGYVEQGKTWYQDPNEIDTSGTGCYRFARTQWIPFSYIRLDYISQTMDTIELFERNYDYGSSPIKSRLMRFIKQ